MLRLSILVFSHLIVLCIRCHVRATNTSVSTVSTNLACNALCFDLYIDSVDKKDTIHNIIILLYILYMSTLSTLVFLMHLMLCMLTMSIQMTHTFVLITFVIFNRFSIRKSFRKLRLRVFQPYHQILYMSKLLIQDKNL